MAQQRVVTDAHIRICKRATITVVLELSGMALMRTSTDLIDLLLST